MSGKRDSNSRPSAWKADALSTELFPHKRNHTIPFIQSGESRIRTYEDEVSGVTVRPSWPLWYLPNIILNRADGGTRTHDLLITNQLL